VIDTRWPIRRTNRTMNRGPSTSLTRDCSHLMKVFAADSAILSLLSGLLLSMFLGMLLVWAWVLYQIWRRRPILPEEPAIPLRPAPWGGMTVFWLVVLYLVVNGGVSRLYMTAMGRIPPQAKQVDQAKPRPPDQAPQVVVDLKAGDVQEMSQADILMQLAIINSLLLVSVPLLARYTSGATLADFGVSLVGWQRQLGLGVCAALFMTPGVIAVQSVAVRLWHSRRHPIEEMVLDTFSARIAFLAVVSTIVLAPMIEELLFRGTIQRWLSRLAIQRPSSSSIGEKLHLSELENDLAGGINGSSTWSGKAKESHQVGNALDPHRLEARSSIPIVSTSLLFASMHAPQWPAPIAIFVLSLALGAIYQRTGSLIAVIAMHGTFNGFSTLVLLLEALSRQIEPHHAVQQVGPAVGCFFYLFTCV
jgi:membrane protease YdiL (CAAX protease family)